MLKSIVVVLSCLLVSSFAHAADQKEWTLLVFMNGNNNLDTYGAMDINEMETVGSTDKVNVVVQWASYAATSVKRVFVQKDNDPNTVTSPVVEDIGAADMGDYRTLIEFIRWGVQHYPAKHYFVDVWDHGSGWHLKALDGTMRPKDISWDDKSGNHITTEQLGQALHEASNIMGHKVDIYGSDACLMGMAEVVGEMSDVVGTFVGSEETEPLKGWPYDALLARWNALSDMNGAAIGKILAEEYVKSYQGGSQGTEQVQFSALDVSKYSALTHAVKSFGDKLRKLDKAAKAKIISSADSSQKFAYSDYVDLVDFANNVEAANVEGLSRGDTADVVATAKAFVLASYATENYAKSNGVAMWIPTQSYSFDDYKTRYAGLHFAAESGWGDTLASLLAQ